MLLLVVAEPRGDRERRLRHPVAGRLDREPLGDVQHHRAVDVAAGDHVDDARGHVAGLLVAAELRLPLPLGDSELVMGGLHDAVPLVHLDAGCSACPAVASACAPGRPARTDALHRLLDRAQPVAKPGDPADLVPQV